MTKAEARRLAAMTSLEEVRRFLAPVLAEKKRKAATRRERSAPRRAREATDRNARNARMSIIREQVLTRAEGRCELCGEVAAEAHHLISGPLRRKMESVGTVLALCQAHHLAIHRGSVYALELARAYCQSAGMHDAAAALAKRLDKLHEAAARAGRGGPDAP